jgi:DNA-binding MarR family transcriptional regulator
MLSGLAREIGKKTPFAVPAEEAFLNILRTCSVLSAQANRVLREKGLAEPSYNILRILRGAGPEGRCGYEIAQHLVAQVPDMTRLIDRLEKLGLLERKRIDQDRRLVRCFITKDGLKLLKEIDEPLIELHKKQFARLTRAQIEQINELMVAARESAAG